MSESRTLHQAAALASHPIAVRRDYVEGEIIAEKYKLVRPIATGGMGTVWVARNLTLDVLVALKLIRSDVAAPLASGRLLHEARAAARLGHPAIVRIFDFGESSQDDPYIIMELLDGESLAGTLERRTRLGVHRALQTLLPIADALSVAHAKGIVHRDLKPENILLHRSESGSIQPKIVDFGIARFGREENKRLTQDGMVMGSPAYMSPEQARGQEDVDHRGDIWAFAVVLYEALTGTLPFDAPNNFALLRAVVENDPIPITELAVADAELWKIMEPALRKNRDQRWQSMRAFGAALASWLITHGVRQDICGASLESTWLAAKNEDGSRSSAPPARPEPEGAPKVHAEVTGETAAMLSLPAASAGTKARKIWAVSLIAVMFVAGFGLARRFVVPVSSGGSGATSVSAAGESNGSLKTAVQGGQRPSPELLAAELPNRAANSEAADSAAPASSANRRTSARAWLRRGAGGEPRVKASTSELKLPY